jgi:hypothetical protein
MADPVSIILGAIPLLATAFKGYSAVSKKLRIFRHYSRETDRFNRTLERQRFLFRNECHLLLRLTEVEEEILSAMMDDSDHHSWTDESLYSKFQETLKSNYEPCRDVMEDVCMSIKALESQLQGFDVFQKQTREVSGCPCLLSTIVCCK